MTEVFSGHRLDVRRSRRRHDRLRRPNDQDEVGDQYGDVGPDTYDTSVDKLEDDVCYDALPSTV